MWRPPTSDLGSISAARSILEGLPLILAATALVAVSVLVPWWVVGTEQPPCRRSRVAHMTLAQVAGDAQLCSGRAGTHPSVDLRRLTPGVVHTGWFVSFDLPSTCETEPCGVADMGGPSPRGVPTFMGEVVADSVGTAHLSADLDGLQLAPGTQVTLLILRHIPAIKDEPGGRSRPVAPRTPAWLMDAPPSMVGIVTEHELVAVAVLFVDR